MKSRYLVAIRSICILVCTLTICGCGPWTNNIVDLNRDRYVCKINPAQFNNFQGKRILLSTIIDESKNTTNMGYYNPDQTIGYRLFYTKNSMQQPVVSYFWYALKKGFECAGIGVEEHGTIYDAELSLIFKSLTDEEIKFTMFLTKVGKLIYQQDYVVKMPKVASKKHVVLEQRAYRMLDSIVKMILNDPGFQEAFMLINVRTGLIVSAFEKKASFKDIEHEAIRDNSIDIGDFESSAFSGWLIGYQERDDGGYFTVAKETKTGANNTKSSLRVTYKLGKKHSISVQNLKNRDWSMHRGIEFYAKSDHDIILNFSLQDENRDNRLKGDVWFAQNQITTTWKKYRIDFNQLSLSSAPADIKLGGDGTLSLDLIKSFRFAVVPLFNPPESSGTFWIDEVRLY